MNKGVYMHINVINIGYNEKNVLQTAMGAGCHLPLEFSHKTRTGHNVKGN